MHEFRFSNELKKFLNKFIIINKIVLMVKKISIAKQYEDCFISFTGWVLVQVQAGSHRLDVVIIHCKSLNIKVQMCTVHFSRSNNVLWQLAIKFRTGSYSFARISTSTQYTCVVIMFYVHYFICNLLFVIFYL